VNKDDDVAMTRQDLLNKFNSLSDPNQLLNMIKDIKSDMLDHERDKDGKEQPSEETIIKTFKELTNALESVSKTRPIVFDSVANQGCTPEFFLREPTEKTFEKIFDFQDHVLDISTSFGGCLPGSKIVNKRFTDVKMLKKWINPSKEVHFKLLYSASRDGFAADGFHKRCFGKKNTLTIVETDKNNVFGGFLDSAWTKHDAYIASQKSFVFNINLKKSMS